MTRVTRREFAAITSSSFTGLLLAAGCRSAASETADQGRIAARPRSSTVAVAPGAVRLRLGDPRDALLFVPDPLPAAPLPLCVLLHGAGGAGAGIFRRLETACADAKVAVLAPDSRDGTWDGIRDELGPDVRFLDRALARVFDVAPVDAARVSIGGFSDGATYALFVGLMNGDLFRRIVAFSPGFLRRGTPVGRPGIFISHGRGDTVLPVDRCSRRIVPDLEQRGYDVTYKEFDGGHTIPHDVAREALHWAAS